MHLALPPGARAERIPPALQDLLAIIAESYALGSRPEAPEKSTRRIEAHVPVHCVDFWSTQDIRDHLHFILERFWKTRVSIRVTALDQLANIQVETSPARQGSPADHPARVWAFAPDMDSLAALKQELRADRGSLVLVALDTPETGRVDSAFLEPLRRHLTHRPSTHLWRLGVSRLLRLHSHRVDTWRLLHLCLTAAVSVALGHTEVQFFENGVANLQLPITASSLSEPAPHTADPELVAALSELMSRIMEVRFQIQNPFIHKTPAEVIYQLIGTGDDDSSLGAHVIEALAESENSPEMRIDRNISTLGALLASPSPEDRREETLGAGLVAPMNENIADAYIRVVRELPALPDRELIAQLTGRSGPRPGRTHDLADTVLDLSRRHLESVRRVLARATRHRAQQIVNGTLPPSCLLIRAAVPREPEPHARQPTFRLRGDRWEIWFQHGETVYLNHAKGFAYLHVLLAHPGVFYSAYDLRSIIAGGKAAPYSSLGALADTQAIRAYNTRLKDLRAELDAANDNNDIGRADSARHELELLESELRRSLNLYGRPRANNDIERARKSVSNAIHRALQRIRKQHPSLAYHMQSALKIGAYLSYAPHDDITWLT